MTKKEFKINDSFVVNALRNCGYNNTTAIADIIDNSVEPEVESTFVKVDFETEGKGAETTIKSILIIDDGVGMPMEILEEAMALGSQTGKNGTDNLGMYGTGLKSASLSIGQVLEVFTKTETSKLNYAKLSIEDAVTNNGDINIYFDSFDENSEERLFFDGHIKCGHGTIVKISSLDKLSNKNYQNFKGAIKRKVGEIFNKFIYGNVVKFYVGKVEVPYVELMGNIQSNIVIGEGSFDADGHNIRYKAYYLPMIGGESTEEDDETHSVTDNGTEYTMRNSANQGLYIYRNNRLVGQGLIFGMWARHPNKNGFRCEIYMDGTCDHLFGSSFTKMVSERARTYMSQSLYDGLVAHIKPFALESHRRDDRAKKERTVNDPELIKANQEFYKRVAEKQNKNMMLKVNRKGENHKREDEAEKEHQVRGKQKNPNPIKERTNKWLGGFEEQPLGRNGEMFVIEHNVSKPIIVINTDHSFYQKFYSTLNNEQKFIMAQVISCHEIAKQNVNYYGSEEVRALIDCYEDTRSTEVMKSLSY